MNILVIGNGFDLAHGLPTRYNDFLDIVDIHRRRREHRNNIDDIYPFGEITKRYGEEIHFAITANEFQTIIKLLDNFWIEYFIKIKSSIGENWIDFESEITKVLKGLDKADYTITDGKIGNRESMIDSLKEGYPMDGTKIEIIKLLEKDLDNLILMLETYLNSIVKNNFKKGLSKNLLIESLDIDKILSFNYTDTYENIYDTNRKIEYDYIHGKIREENSKNESNIVLGIDEYLAEDKKNNSLEMIYFKKYFQRIYKKTGNAYIKWLDDQKEYLQEKNKIIKNYEKGIIKHVGEAVDELETIYNKIDRIYIFGHSLDVTDKDILEKLFNVSDAKVIVFYCSQYDYRTKITNLVKVIGQDKLIEKTGGANPSIIFVDQNENLDKLREQGIIEKLSEKEPVFN